MSNLNENDIGNKQNEVFQVEEIDTISFDENGLEEGTWTGFAVTKINDPANYCYECRDKHNADKLCRDLNDFIMKYNILDDELPEPVNIDSLQLEGNDLFENLALKINEKHELIRKLQEAKNHELACKIDYTHKTNQIKLHPDDVKEDLELSKAPTEKQINAYCEEKYQREFNMYTIAKANTSLLNTKLDLINDYISLERYILRMALK